MARLLIPAAAISLLAGCGSVSTTARPDSYYESTGSAASADSLFAGDATTLSDEAIRNILDYKYVPPALSRIALMSVDRNAWSSWSEELAMASAAMRAQVLDRLRAAATVYDASYLPSILVPENRTVPHLREAAARYQADLLLVYRSYCQSFEKYRFFSADTARAYCGVEAVLLDTRTGLVPFTTVATRAYDVVENSADTSFQETQLRAQLDATAAAMSEVGANIAGFLENPG